MSRRRLVLTIGAAAVVVATLATVITGLDRSSGGSPAQAGLPPATTTVAKTTLTQTTHVSGTLSYGVPQGLKAPPGDGTITWLPPEGGTVQIGTPAYKLDNKPVMLIKGTVPVFRTLTDGLSGPDVLQLEKYLADAGYLPVQPNTKFGSATTAAVLDWQDATGQPETGQVKPGELVVQPAAIRVAMHEVAVGDKMGAEGNNPVYTYNTTEPKIIVGLDVAKQHLVKKGLKATITLPDGKSVPGKVSKVTSVATQPAEGSGDPPNIPVVVTLDNPKAVGGLDSAPVDVALVAAQKKGVLVVPVNALMALAEGGYGVQVVDGAKVGFVAVKLGMFAGGKVEISGTGIAEGTVVGVPS